MLRRGMLEWGAAGASSAVVGCVREGALPPVAPVLGPDTLAALARMDLVVAAIRSSKPRPEAFGVAVKDAATVEAAHDLATKSLATMHTVATFSDLPPEAQRHPQVQRRMWAALPDIDDATMSMADWLDGLDADARRRIDERVRHDEGATMRVVERLDDEAKRANVPETHRLKMRTVATHLAWRLKNQGTGAVIDDLVGRVDRVMARHGADAEIQRAIAAKVAEARLFGAPGPQAQPSGPPPPAPPSGAPPPATAPSGTPPAGEGEYVPIGAEGPARVRFLTDAPPAAVERLACELRPIVTVGGRQRPVDLRVERPGGTVPCGAAGDALRGLVRVARSGEQWEVVIEIDTAGTSQAETGELRQALREVGGELRRRAAAHRPPQVVPAVAPPEPEPDPWSTKTPKTRASAKVLTASAILWGIGLVTAAPGGIMIAAGSPSGDGGLVIGGAVFLTVASLVAIAGIVTLIVAGVLLTNDR